MCLNKALMTNGLRQWEKGKKNQKTKSIEQTRKSLQVLSTYSRDGELSPAVRYNNTKYNDVSSFWYYF